MNRIRIKVCGITRQADAHAAVHFGVDALGFIFVKKTPRYIAPDSARAIIETLPPFITRVGVFVNSPMDAVQEIVSRSGLTQVQLHGNESSGYCDELKSWNRSLTICKVFRIGLDRIPTHISGYDQAIDCVLLDTFIKGADGGTGEIFDWNLIQGLSLKKPLILAGGLSLENVEEAVRKVVPYGIDINSGVEDEPGKKNPQLIEKLISKVRHVEKDLPDQQ